MSYAALQTSRFSRSFKKLHANQKPCVHEAVREILNNPISGELKKGDLAGLYVWKFRCLGQLWLLGYTVDSDVRLVYLEALGPHENFYRSQKT